MDTNPITLPSSLACAGNYSLAEVPETWDRNVVRHLKDVLGGRTAPLWPRSAQIPGLQWYVRTTAGLEDDKSHNWSSLFTFHGYSSPENTADDYKDEHPRTASIIKDTFYVDDCLTGLGCHFLERGPQRLAVKRMHEAEEVVDEFFRTPVHHLQRDTKDRGDTGDYCSWILQQFPQCPLAYWSRHSSCCHPNSQQQGQAHQAPSNIWCGPDFWQPWLTCTLHCTGEDHTSKDVATEAGLGSNGSRGLGEGVAELEKKPSSPHTASYPEIILHQGQGETVYPVARLQRCLQGHLRWVSLPLSCLHGHYHLGCHGHCSSFCYHHPQFGAVWSPTAGQAVGIYAKALDIPWGSVFAWTDSSIVICWLNSTPARLNTYVMTCVYSVFKRDPAWLWRHVRTNDR